MDSTVLLATASIMVASGCVVRKPPFSHEQFVRARSQCKAPDAYVLAVAPNTIGFHGTSDNHVRQANCLKQKLVGTDVQTLVLGSQLHERP